MMVGVVVCSGRGFEIWERCSLLFSMALKCVFYRLIGWSSHWSDSSVLALVFLWLRLLPRFGIQSLSLVPFPLVMGTVFFIFLILWRIFSLSHSFVWFFFSFSGAFKHLAKR